MSRFIEMFGKCEKYMPLSEVAKEVFAGGDKPKDYSDVKTELYKYPVFSNGIEENGLLCYAKDYKVAEPSITISARGTIGFVAIRKPYYTPVVRLIAIIPNDNVDLTFLYYALQQVRFENTGAVQGQLTLPTLKRTEIPVPSIDEQKQFSAIVQQADKSKFGDFKSRFIEMFGDCEKQQTIQSVCNLFIDGDWIEAKDQSESGIRLIQTGNVGDGVYLDKSDKARYITEETFRRLNCTEIFEGDILVSRLPEPVGRACVLPNVGKAITAVDCTIIRLKDIVTPEFFISFTQTSLYQGQIIANTAGSTRIRVSRSKLGEIKMPVPSIDEQKQFSAIVQQADKSKSICQIYENKIHSICA